VGALHSLLSIVELNSLRKMSLRNWKYSTYPVVGVRDCMLESMRQFVIGEGIPILRAIPPIVVFCVGFSTF